MITHLQMISTYVPDLPRAKAFCTEKLSFDRAAEFDDSQQQLVWLIPAAAAAVELATEIALCAAEDSAPRVGTASGIVFTAREIEATYKEVKRREAGLEQAA